MYLTLHEKDATVPEPPPSDKAHRAKRLEELFDRRDVQFIDKVKRKMVERAAPSMNGAQPCKDDWAQPMENLMLAAHFLQIAQLLHIAQAAFAFHIRGLTLVEKARQFLHIENDFTPEEEQAVC
eukprot:GHVN01098500.1.p1 GENE.GHVN01098500.1~~GHVN01098500.1.p1  ORF type:complete len:137 (+),score=17.03 GHVN01098500.1:41-412(+)